MPRLRHVVVALMSTALVVAAVGPIASGMRWIDGMRWMDGLPL